MKTLQELRAEKTELMAQIDGATAEQFAELRTKIEKVNLQIKEAETAENERNKEKADAEMRAATKKLQAKEQQKKPKWKNAASLCAMAKKSHLLKKDK